MKDNGLPRAAQDLIDKLAASEAQVDAIKREIAAGPCRQYGHSWKHHGGRNAGCSDLCSCSIPVYICEKCGDCDYGDNTEAAEKMADCALSEPSS